VSKNFCGGTEKKFLKKSCGNALQPCRRVMRPNFAMEFTISVQQLTAAEKAEGEMSKRIPQRDWPHGSWKAGAPMRTGACL